MPYISDEEYQALMGMNMDGAQQASSQPTVNRESAAGSTLDQAGNAAMAVDPRVGAALKVAGFGTQVMGANKSDKQAEQQRRTERTRYKYGANKARVQEFLGMRRNRMDERSQANSRNDETMVELLAQYDRTHGRQ